MADRYYNRDRNRPYEEDYSEDEYGQDYRAPGRYDRDFDYRRDYEMRDRDYADYSGEWDYDEDRFFDRNWDAMQRGGYGASYNRRGMGSRNSDYDYDYDAEYDRWNRGNYSGGGYGNYGYGRGAGSYGRNVGGGYGRGSGRGYGSRGYGRNYGGDRGMGAGRYRSSFSGIDFSSDVDTDYGADFDYDYDFDTTPTSWTYQEIWLIPGPFSGVGPQGYRRSDERIREEIHERLTRHGRLNASDIQVQVEDGEATLSGTVDSRRAKRYAEDLVESVAGVQQVHNELRVQKEQRYKQQGPAGQKIPIRQEGGGQRRT